MCIRGGDASGGGLQGWRFPHRTHPPPAKSSMRHMHRVGGRTFASLRSCILPCCMYIRKTKCPVYITRLCLHEPCASPLACMSHILAPMSSQGRARRGICHHDAAIMGGPRCCHHGPSLSLSLATRLSHCMAHRSHILAPASGTLHASRGATHVHLREEGHVLPCT